MTDAQSGGLDPAAHLERILSVDLARVRQDEEALFDRSARGRPLVLMGAGQLGRRTLAGLRALGIEPLAFADNARDKQGTTIEGLRVLAPREAAREHAKTAAFVVTIWGAGSPHRYAYSHAQLQSLGCDVVLPFQLLYWKHADTFLPHYTIDLPHKVIEAAADIRRAFALMRNERSRLEFVEHLMFRATAGWSPRYEPPGFPQYLPPHEVAWRDDEWIVDGGAYDGDTLRSWVAWHDTRFAHWLAIEPDPANASAFTRAAAELPVDAQQRIELKPVALGAAPGTLQLAATGTASTTTRISGPSAVRSLPAADTVEVPVQPLDALVGDAPVSFIKLDIEGAELEALEGMRGVVQRRAPVLAICAYHRQDHLWRVPLAIHALREDYVLHLRSHNEEGWDLVCYAVPAARSPETGARSRPAP